MMIIFVYVGFFIGPALLQPFINQSLLQPRNCSGIFSSLKFELTRNEKLMLPAGLRLRLDL
jgi:hypothetical protein